MPARKGKKKNEHDFYRAADNRHALLTILAGRYFEWLEVRNYSPRTVESRRNMLAYFFMRP